jgi:hypothetical protein
MKITLTPPESSTLVCDLPRMTVFTIRSHSGTYIKVDSSMWEIVGSEDRLLGGAISVDGYLYRFNADEKVNEILGTLSVEP